MTPPADAIAWGRVRRRDGRGSAARLWTGGPGAAISARRSTPATPTGSWPTSASAWTASPTRPGFPAGPPPSAWIQRDPDPPPG